MSTFDSFFDKLEFAFSDITDGCGCCAYRYMIIDGDLEIFVEWHSLTLLLIYFFTPNQEIGFFQTVHSEEEAITVIQGLITEKALLRGQVLPTT